MLKNHKILKINHFDKLFQLKIDERDLIYRITQIYIFCGIA